MRKREIKLIAGDTEPLEIWVDADGLSNLDDFQSGEAYFWEEGEASNHVDGASISVSDSASKLIEFDPSGAASDGGDAFDEAGTYLGYILITWSDSDETRHPGAQSEFLRVIVTANRE